MESKIQQFSAFQIYSTGVNNNIILMVDHLWIDDNRVFFRVVESVEPNKNFFRKENRKNVYSIKREDLVSIRCRFYF
jgi:hypothetical protein